MSHAQSVPPDSQPTQLFEPAQGPFDRPADSFLGMGFGVAPAGDVRFDAGQHQQSTGGCKS